MKIKRGTTRTVILVGSVALKIPTFKSWRLFLSGLQANMNEVMFGTMGHPLLAPVKWSLPGGLLVVMLRCKVWPTYSNEGAENLAFWREQAKQFPELPLLELVEDKVDSVGEYKGRILAVDYGS